MIEYKAGLHGMTVERVGEAYTFQTCPSCGKRHKAHGRAYICSCGFEGHRDLVGAANIRRRYVAKRKYLGQDEPPGSSLRVAGEGPARSVMASHTGVRYKPLTSCNPLSGRRPGDLVSPMIASKPSCEGDPSCEAATLKRERAAQSGSRIPGL